MEHTNQEEVKSLIIKYGIILILFAIVSRFIIGQVGLLFWDLFEPNIQNSIQNQEVFSMVMSLSMILTHALVAAVIFTDVKKNSLGWLIVLLALFYPSIGALLLIFCKTIIPESV